MSTHSGEIQNTYVQLITAPSSGTNGTVKFHAQMTDASGGDFEEWGFFYKKSTTDVAVHTGNTIDDPGGSSCRQSTDVTRRRTQLVYPRRGG